MIPKNRSTNLNKVDCRLNPFQQGTSNNYHYGHGTSNSHEFEVLSAHFKSVSTSITFYIVLNN